MVAHATANAVIGINGDDLMECDDCELSFEDRIYKALGMYFDNATDFTNLEADVSEGEYGGEIDLEIWFDIGIQNEEHQRNRRDVDLAISSGLFQGVTAFIQLLKDDIEQRVQYAIVVALEDIVDSEGTGVDLYTLQTDVAMRVSLKDIFYNIEIYGKTELNVCGSLLKIYTL